MYVERQTVLMMMIASMGIILLLVFAFIYMVYVQRAKRNSAHSLQHSALMQQLQGNIMENERYFNELAKLLHTSFQQKIVSLKYQVESIGKSVAMNRLNTLEDLNEISNALSELNRKFTHLSEDINLEFIRTQSLKALIESALVKIQEEKALPYDLQYGEVPHLSDSTKLILYRIAQEAINNAAAHAMPTFLEVTVRGIKNQVLLTVSDNGLGFSREQIFSTPTSGIPNMRSRALMIGAHLEIKSSSEEGTKVIITLPLGQGHHSIDRTRL